MSRLGDLYEREGQSPWIDNIRREWLEDGTLADLVARGVRGVTSNPSIFAKALAEGDAYDRLVAEAPTREPEALFEYLAVRDVRDACDVLAEVHRSAVEDRLAGRRRHDDGFVSLEVSPRLAHDTSATVAAALRLAESVGRANLMVKIPATVEGLPAVSEVLGAGVSVNVTLIFSLERYAQVLDAWVEGLRKAQRRRHEIGGIASVASFFVSRVDTAVDALLGEGDPRRGTAANAQAAAAYRLYRERMAREDVQDLLEAGAQVQRPLWASTSTKNPAYPDLLYVDRLVGPETVNTMPDATLEAAALRVDAGSSWLSEAHRAEAEAALQAVRADVDLAAVTDRLEREGVAAFVASYDELLGTVARRAERA